MLKTSHDGLSKVWKPANVWNPFFSGGKITFGQNEEFLFSEYDGNVKITKVIDPSDVVALIEDEEAFEKIACFCLNPTKNELVVATVKFTLRLWDLEGKVCAKNIKAHKMPILCMEYDPTGTLVATGSADRSVRVWDISKGYCTHSFTGHTDIVRTVTFHPHSKRLLLFSTADDSTIRCYDLKKNACVAVFTEHVSLPTSIAVSTDGNMLISAGRDKVLNFYDLTTFQHVKTLPVLEELEGVICLPNPKVFGLTGKKNAHIYDVIVTAGSSGALRVFCVYVKGQDLSTIDIVPLCTVPTSLLEDSANISEEILTLRGLSHLFLLRKSDSIVSVSKDQNICIYSINEIVNKYRKSQQNESHRLSVSPARTLVGSYGDILDISVLSTKTTEQNTLLYNIAIVTNSAQVRVVNHDQHCELLEGHSDIVLALDSSPDGCWLATCSKDRTSRLWHYEDASWQYKAICTGHTEAVSALAISQFHATYASRKVFLVTGAADRVIKKYTLPLHTFTIGAEVAKLMSVYSARAHEKDINCIALSPNDLIVATASQDKTIKLWNSDDLSSIATLKGHKRGVWRVVFSPVDKVLLSCSGDRTMKLWSMVDYTQLRTIEGHSASVLNAMYINFATQVISSAADGLLRLHTIRTGECEQTADEHGDRVWAIAALPKKLNSHLLGNNEEKKEEEAEDKLAMKYICTGGSDGKLILWKDVTEEEEQKRIDNEEARLVMEQSLSNDIAHKRYHKAIKAALSLNMSNRLLQIFTSILEEDNTEIVMDGTRRNIFAEVWSKRLDQYVSQWGDEETKKIIVLMKEWNTNSRYCYICQVLLHSIFRLVSYDKLMTFGEFREALPSLVAYSERHFQRINRLSEASFLLEYVAGIAAIPIANSAAEQDPPTVHVVSNGTDGSTSSEKVLVNSEQVHLVSGSEDSHDNHTANQHSINLHAEQEEEEHTAELFDDHVEETQESREVRGSRKRAKKHVDEEPSTTLRTSVRAKKAKSV